MEKDIIISIDIGGTTFESGILNKDYLNIIDMSAKWHVRDYSDSESLIEAICSQIRELLDKNKHDDDDILPEKSVNYEIGTRYNQGLNSAEILFFYNDFTSFYYFFF